MQRLEYNYRFPTNPARPQDDHYKVHARRALDSGFAEKIAELVLDTSRKGTICFAQFYIQEVPTTPYESTLRAQIDYDFARELPVVIHSGFEFEGIPIKAPEQLTFKERVKFIFTGKYPR